jgi:hypothetical protein
MCFCAVVSHSRQFDATGSASLSSGLQQINMNAAASRIRGITVQLSTSKAPW